MLKAPSIGVTMERCDSRSVGSGDVCWLGLELQGADGCWFELRRLSLGGWFFNFYLFFVRVVYRWKELIRKRTAEGKQPP